jgi:hypothetical protein
VETFSASRIVERRAVKYFKGGETVLDYKERRKGFFLHNPREWLVSIGFWFFWDFTFIFA